MSTTTGTERTSLFHKFLIEKNVSYPDQRNARRALKLRVLPYAIDITDGYTFKKSNDQERKIAGKTVH